MTVGTAFWDKNHIYVFTHLNLYVFGPKPKSDTKKSGDPVFSRLVSDEIKPSEKWPGFDPNYGRFFAEKNLLCVIIEAQRYSCWGPDGTQVVDNRPIGEPDYDPPDEEQGDDSNAGALINPEDNNGKYARIRGKKVCSLTIEDEEMYNLGQCLDVSADPRKFPPDIVAAIKPKDNNWYFFNKNGKYCKRADGSTKEVCFDDKNRFFNGFKLF